MARFIELTGQHGDIVINISQITSLHPNGDTCYIYVKGKRKEIDIEASYDQVKEAINRAYIKRDRDIVYIIGDDGIDPDGPAVTIHDV